MWVIFNVASESVKIVIFNQRCKFVLRVLVAVVVVMPEVRIRQEPFHPPEIQESVVNFLS